MYNISSKNLFFVMKGESFAERTNSNVVVHQTYIHHRILYGVTSEKFNKIKILLSWPKCITTLLLSTTIHRFSLV